MINNVIENQPILRLPCFFIFLNSLTLQRTNDPFEILHNLSRPNSILSQNNHTLHVRHTISRFRRKITSPQPTARIFLNSIYAGKFNTSFNNATAEAASDA